jgi:hypothetical protein
LQNKTNTSEYENKKNKTNTQQKTNEMKAHKHALKWREKNLNKEKHSEAWS